MFPLNSSLSTNHRTIATREPTHESILKTRGTHAPQVHHKSLGNGTRECIRNHEIIRAFCQSEKFRNRRTRASQTTRRAYAPSVNQKSSGTGVWERNGTTRRAYTPPVTQKSSGTGARERIGKHEEHTRLLSITKVREPSSKRVFLRNTKGTVIIYVIIFLFRLLGSV